MYYRAAKSAKRTLIHKIIERKYFKKPQETNLLTWEAKEQIRFLSREYPEEWTVERLAESFPCSEYGVIKILKSKFVPRNLDEIRRHDDRVKKNWLALQTGDGPQGPIVTKYQQLIGEGKFALLKNAAGIKHLPMPGVRALLSQGPEKKGPPGVFESIVKDYVDKKKRLESKAEVAARQEGGIEVQVLLDSIAKSSKVKKYFQKDAKINAAEEDLDSGFPKMKQSEKHTELDAEPDGVPDFITNSLNTYSEGERAMLNEPYDTKHTHGEMRKSQSFRNMGDFQNTRDGRSDIGFYSEGTDIVKPLATMEEDSGYINSITDSNQQPKGRTKRRGRRKSQPIMSIQQFQEMQMKDTGKLPSNSAQKSLMDLANVGQMKTENALLMHKSPEQNEDTYEENEELSAQLKFDEEGGRVKTYTYDETSGYQYPLGKEDVGLQKIRVPKKGGSVYRKGRGYYDEDGDLIFRVP